MHATNTKLFTVTEFNKCKVVKAGFSFEYQVNDDWSRLGVTYGLSPLLHTINIMLMLYHFYWD